ncbi:unnamed protein product, partial [Vitis vinifera]
MQSTSQSHAGYSQPSSLGGISSFNNGGSTLSSKKITDFIIVTRSIFLDMHGIYGKTTEDRT